MERFTKNNLDDFRKELQGVLDKFGKEKSLVFQIGNITFRDHNLKAALECNIKGQLTKEESDYDYYQPLNSLPDRGTRIKFSSGRDLVIVGFNSRARKNKILLRSDDGKKFHCSIPHMKMAYRAMGAKA